MALVAIHYEALARGVPTMKDQDSTEKDAKISTDAQVAVTPEADETAANLKELTDEQFAGVIGGIVGSHIGTSFVKKQ
jgi:Trm5-related predicted tRNA methylase